VIVSGQRAFKATNAAWKRAISMIKLELRLGKENYVSTTLKSLEEESHPYSRMVSVVTPSAKL
jgi:hypothetical protein